MGAHISVDSSGNVLGTSPLVRLVSESPIPRQETEFWDVDLVSGDLDVLELEKHALQTIVHHLCSSMLANNPKTRNYNTLLNILAADIQTLLQEVESNNIHALTNMLFISRIILQHFVENCSSDQLRQQLDDEETNHLGNDSVVVSMTQSEKTLAETILSRLLHLCVEIPVNTFTRDLHTESVKMILVCTSTQMYTLPGDEQLFLDRFPTFLPFIQYLWGNFVRRLPDDPEFLASIKKRQPSGSSLLQVGNQIIESVFRLLLLPFQVYRFFFSKENDHFSLSDHSALLLLVLSYQKSPSTLAQNPIRTMLKTLQDSDSSPNHKETPSISFDRLYDAIVASPSESEWTFILFFSLLQENLEFRNFVYAKSDLDLIIVPLLQSLYHEEDLDSNKAYVIVITLLLLSQDQELSRTIHSEYVLTSVSWYKDSILQEISLGSLTMLILLRTIQHNISRLKDPYLHSNCLAILSNMAPFAVNLHAKTAQTMIMLLSALSKRFQILSKKKTPQTKEEEPLQETELEELLTFGDFIRLLLEITYACLTDRNLVGNVDLVYCLLHDQFILNAFENHEMFWDIIAHLKAIIIYFDEYLETHQIHNGQVSVRSVKALLQKAAKYYSHAPAAEIPGVSHSLFQFESLPNDEEFFLPYIWECCYVYSDIDFNPLPIQLFHPSPNRPERRSL